MVVRKWSMSEKEVLFPNELAVPVPALHTGLSIAIFRNVQTNSAALSARRVKRRNFSYRGFGHADDHGVPARDRRKASLLHLRGASWRYPGCATGRPRRCVVRPRAPNAAHWQEFLFRLRVARGQ